MTPVNTAQRWSTSSIVGLSTLLVVAVTAPIGWMVHRYKFKRDAGVSTSNEQHAGHNQQTEESDDPEGHTRQAEEFDVPQEDDTPRAEEMHHAEEE